MILHLSDDVAVQKKDVIAILNLETAMNPITQDFLQSSMAEGNVRMIGKEDYKSIIICRGKDKNLVYYSPITAKTLKTRSKSLI